MSELAVGSIAGLAANDYVIDVASGSQLTQTGMVLQVVSTTKTDTFTASVTVGSKSTITGLSASITPSSTSSKILVQVSVTGGGDSNVNRPQYYSLQRDGSDVAVGDAAGSRQQSSTSSGGVDVTRGQGSGSINFLDSPASTSSLTYSVTVGMEASGTNTVYVNRGQLDDDVTETHRTVSTITLMEIAG